MNGRELITANPWDSLICGLYFSDERAFISTTYKNPVSTGSIARSAFAATSSSPERCYPDSGNGGPPPDT
jgi:hypothetical protein